MNLLEDSTFEVASTINVTLSDVLDLESSTLLVDPFHKNTYYVFRNEEDSKEKSAEIIRQINQFEKNNPNFNLKSVSGINGELDVFRDAGHRRPIPEYSVSLVSNGSFASLGSWNDEISSYWVLYNTNYDSNKRYVIRFYEHSNFKGSCLTAYGFFAYEWNPNNSMRICWEDYNMHTTLMKGGIFKKYWGDQVSSIRWTLE